MEILGHVLDVVNDPVAEKFEWISLEGFGQNIRNVFQSTDPFHLDYFLLFHLSNVVMLDLDIDRYVWFSCSTFLLWPS